MIHKEKDLKIKEIVAIDLIDIDGNVSQRIELNKDSLIWKLCNCGFSEEKNYNQKTSYINLINNEILPPLNTNDTFGLQKLK